MLLVIKRKDQSEITVMQNGSFVHNLEKPIAVTALKEQLVASYIEHFSQKRLPRFEIIWVQEGNCTMLVNGYPLQLTTHTACILLPGQLRFAAIGEDIKGFHISISEEYFHLTAGHIPPAFYQGDFLNRPFFCRLDKRNTTLLELILSAIQQECMGETSTRRGIMLGWLKVLFEYFDWSETSGILELPVRRNQEISKQFFKLIAERFTTQKKVSYYARLLAITPTHLNQAIRKISGYPASYHIQRCIMMEAKRLALNGDKSMKEISYALGFDDVSHFSKFFKNNAGLNFTDFRKLICKDEFWR